MDSAFDAYCDFRFGLNSNFTFWIDYLTFSVASKGTFETTAYKPTASNVPHEWGVACRFALGGCIKYEGDFTI